MSGPPSRSLRFALAPRWMALHLFVIAAAVTMVLLGRWQLDVSNSKHFSLQNFAYALQWWAFSIFAIFMWVRVMRDAARHEDPHADDARDRNGAAQPVQESVTYRRYVMPQSATTTAPAADAEHAAYNDYLAQLAGGDEAERRSE